MNEVPRALHPQLMSFDVFGTLLDVRAGSYATFQSILDDCGAANIDVKLFWEDWERRNIAQYWQPYRGYRAICRESLAQSFAHFGVAGDPALIDRYFAAFGGFPLFADVPQALEGFAKRCPLAIVSNIDDDLLAATELPKLFDLVCTAERARGYKPDGTLFRYLLDNAGVPRDAILHSGQSQFTDLVGGKPLGLAIAWVNRRGVALSSDVPKPDWIVADLDGVAALLG
jgi:2-haloacid dehalogenase